MNSQVILITPEMAEKWLRENNTHNRPLYKGTIERYAREMKAGAWAVTNQGIGFADDGVLLDGQQRLSAIVMAGVPVRMLVVQGLPHYYGNNGTGELFTQDVIDTNKPRSVPDILTLGYGLENANTKVAIANMIVCAIKGTRMKPSSRIVHKIIELYSDEIEFILSGRPSVRGISYTPCLTGLVLAAKVDLDKAVEFKNQYYKGAELKMGSPVLTLRNFMLSRSDKSLGGTTPRMTVLNLTMTALKYYFDGKELRQLKSSDTAREYFIGKQKMCASMVLDWMNL